MLDVKRLRVLREVARQGSFSAAADRLAYTQSAVSQQIAALERETGVTLVDRGARGVRLTDAGRMLCERAEGILASLRAAEAELEALADLRSGRLRLAAFPTAAATIVPTAIAEFRRRHPAVELALELHEPHEGLGFLAAGELDLALTIEAPSPAQPPPGLDFVHLLDDPMRVALPAGHRLAARRSVRLGDLAAEAWMLGTTGACPDSLLLVRACQAAGFEPNVAFETDDYNAIQGFVAAGVGVALIPEMALTVPRDEVVVRPLAGRPLTRRVSAAVPAGRHRAAATAAMLDVLLDVVHAERAPRLAATA